MKVVAGFLIYMAIGGVFTGLLINAEFKRCGPQVVKTWDVAITAAGWPALLVTTLFVDEAALTQSKCEVIE